MASNHEKLRRLTDGKEAPSDHSLRGNALSRALSGGVPKTLTPYEWEQWYAEHGVPHSHLAPPETKQSNARRRTLGKMNSSDDDQTPTYAIWLGRAGLLPFVGLLVVLYLDVQHQQVWAKALSTYTLAILCFLVGSWWGLALIRRTPAALIMSNIVVLVAFFGHLLLATAPFLLLGAALFLATVVFERRHALFNRQPPYYASLRLQLSLIASASLLLSAMRL
jgi:hypothetical protein